ncbi:MAG: nucleoside-diphosphate sugar epimerase/dehydratase [Pseudomonadota bacterium]|nr:nucleoside-diphosphate sugar epimerase/dehydratase [Pseudomonadota bacterium]
MKTLRQKLAFGHDFFMATCSLPIAMFLRLGNEILFYEIKLIFLWGVCFGLISAGLFWKMGLYSGIWRYASVNDLVAITKSVTLVILVFFPVMFLINRLEWIPRSTPIINWFVLIAFLGGPRFIYRKIKEYHYNGSSGIQEQKRIPALLVGAKDTAEMFLRGILRNPNSAYEILGLISEKEGPVGHQIHGLKVLGTIEEIPKIIKQFHANRKKPQRLIVAKEDINKQSVQKLLLFAEELALGIGRIPSPTDFHEDINENIPIKPIAIEDLLGRPQLTLDRPSMQSLVEGKRILITGAGGTIGAELSRQVARCKPASLSILDNSEYGLYAIDLEIAESYPNLNRAALVASVRNRNRVMRVFEDETPEIVFHAAALKHVPIVEQNPDEGVLTNVEGTRIVADCCRNYKVQLMVLISTDKAVNPTSVMGATKRIAETYCQALDIEKEAETSYTETRFVTVRFGNVLGSTGSVIPLFQRQLARGGPLTVTDPNMKRYFMTVREAVELVLEAAVLGTNEKAETGRVYVLEMGEPIRILDLAHQIILLAGLRPDKDIKIAFTGLREGEKLSEEILHDSEKPEKTKYAGILLASPRTAPLEQLTKQIDGMVDAAHKGEKTEIISLIQKHVPEYKNSKNIPMETIAS